MAEFPTDPPLIYEDLRAFRPPALAIVSPGVAALLGREQVEILIEAISIFDDFNIARQSAFAHGLNVFVVDKETIFFRIDYFDPLTATESSDAMISVHARRIISLKTASEDWVWESAVPIK